MTRLDFGRKLAPRGAHLESTADSIPTAAPSHKPAKLGGTRPGIATVSATDSVPLSYCWSPRWPFSLVGSMRAPHLTTGPCQPGNAARVENASRRRGALDLIPIHRSNRNDIGSGSMRPRTAGAPRSEAQGRAAISTWVSPEPPRRSLAGAHDTTPPAGTVILSGHYATISLSGGVRVNLKPPSSQLTPARRTGAAPQPRASRRRAHPWVFGIAMIGGGAALGMMAAVGRETRSPELPIVSPHCSADFARKKGYRIKHNAHGAGVGMRRRAVLMVLGRGRVAAHLGAVVPKASRSTPDGVGKYPRGGGQTSCLSERSPPLPVLGVERASLEIPLHAERQTAAGPHRSAAATWWSSGGTWFAHHGARFMRL